MIVENLRQFGLNDKEIQVYLSLIASGPAPARIIASQAKVNRGTTYDILKKLVDLGLVSTYEHYHSEDKRQYFAAEPPQKLLDAVENKKRSLENLKVQMERGLPELESMYEKSGSRPVVKYYEGNQGVKTILQDVIATFEDEEEKHYYVYSSSNVREYLRKAYPQFNDERIKNGISVKAIAIGKGGELVGLDERKWLSEQDSSPTYVLIYSGKVAMVSVDAADIPVGVIIEDQGLYQTQKMVFEALWQTL